MVDTPAKKALKIEAFDAPRDMIDAVLRIAKEGKLDVGGVEYLVCARDGRPYVYDINALSNFVADAPRVLGFDPFVRLADWLEREQQRREALVAPALTVPSGLVEGATRW